MRLQSYLCEKSKGMTANVKEWIQYGTAVGMLMVGSGIAIADFVVLDGHIDDSVLWIFAQCLIDAGSIFGVSVYITDRFKRIEREIRGEKGGES